MHSSSLVVATILAASSWASAQPENRPKIYFPRHVKRQYTNTTITSAASQTTRSNVADSTASSSTRRDGLSGLLSSLTEGLGGESSSDSSSDMTVTISSTVISSPTDTPTNDEPETTAAETTEEAEATNTATETSASVGSTGGVPPIVVLPTVGLSVPPLIPSDTESTTAVTANATASGPATSTDSATETVAENTTGTATGTLTSDSPATSLFPSSTVPTTSSGILLAPTGVVTPSSSSGGLIGGLTSVVGGATSAVGGVTSAVGSVTSEILPTGTVNGTDATTGSLTATDTDSGLLPTLLFPSTTFPGTAPTTQTTSTDEPGLSLSLPLTGILPTASSTPIETPVANGTESSLPASETASVPPTLSGSVIPSGTAPITDVPVNSTSPTDTSVLPTVPTASDTVAANSTSVSGTAVPTSGPISSQYPTSAPATVSSEPSVPVNITSAPATTTEESTTPLPTTTSAPIITSPTTVIPSTTTSKPAVTSIPAIGTMTGSTSWLPTTIMVQPSMTTVSTGGAPTTATGLPSTLPKAITQDTEPPEQPEGTELIQVSFKYGENYQFLVDQPLAASQMFDLLPRGLAYAGGINEMDKVVMVNIRPYDTIAPLGYITSQALVYFPTEKIDQLRTDVKLPATPLYNNPNALVRNLTSEINPAIDILYGSTLDSNGNPVSGGDDDTDDSSNGNNPFDSQGPGDQTTNAQKGMTAGIALGAAGVAGAYGAAMFIIARRYKRKKQRHQRSSSITSPSEMRQTGSPALMGGALLSRDFTSSPGYGGVAGNARDSQGSGGNNSARTANISAPVAAENSLGWN